MSTIAAISSPIGAGGIGIVRVSGERALKIADTIFHFAHNSNIKGDFQPWEPLKMHFGTFEAVDFCDKGYAVFFPAKNAFTGEDTVEFYLHGGVRIMQGALDTILKKGARLAENGEFTKRAFLAGRMSLADAEGVIDMINADSAGALRAAYRLMDGEVSKSINDISSSLENIIAGLEAALDYPDEMEDEVLPSLGAFIEDCLFRVDALLATAERGKTVKHGVNVVLAGNVNAGKSSLMNAMLKRDRAIVADIAGTTRDTVEDSLEWRGVRINLVDTAGLRKSDDIVEGLGVERAKKAVESADLVVHVIDKTESKPDDLDFGSKLTFTVYNKCDLGGFGIPRMIYTFGVSAKTGEGVENLLDVIADTFRAARGGGEIITNERHVSALLQAKRELESARANAGGSIDCTLVDLRAAYNSLGEITGKTATEDIIDRIFSKFCVGK